MMQGGSEAPILLHKRRFGAGTHNDLSDPFLSEPVGVPKLVSRTRLGDDRRSIGDKLPRLVEGLDDLDRLDARVSTLLHLR